MRACEWSEAKSIYTAEELVLPPLNRIQRGSSARRSAIANVACVEERVGEGEVRMVGPETPVRGRGAR